MGVNTTTISNSNGEQNPQQTVVGFSETSESSSAFDGNEGKKILGTEIQSVESIAKTATSQNGSYSGFNSSSPYESEYFQNIMHYNGFITERDRYTREQGGGNYSLYTKTYRFGNLNPYGAIANGREFLFFTKPDLHIVDTGIDGSVSLYKPLQNHAFWLDLYAYRKDIIAMLQSSYNYHTGKDPFNHFLQNQCTSNLEINALQAETIDTPQNIYGVGYKYRGSSEASDDNPTFSLEFKDNKWLETYTLFKAYEEYETLKHHGNIEPNEYYIMNKIIHDQFAIYKFIVDEDMETIIYYGKMYGVAPVSLPRDTFGSASFDNGLSYSIEFNAAFYEDMKPDILADFNALSKDYFSSRPYSMSIYNKTLGRVDRRAAEAAYVFKETGTPTAMKSPTGYVYKLKWKGSDKA